MQLPSITPYFVHNYIFVEKVLAAKFMKCLSLESFPLYGIAFYDIIYIIIVKLHSIDCWQNNYHN